MSRRTRRQKHRRPAPTATTTAPHPTALGGYEAGRWSPLRQVPFWPTLDPRWEIDACERQIMQRYARSLHANSPEIRHLVASIVNLVGHLMPLPATTDRAWNRRARDYFLRHVMDTARCELSGRLNWITIQHWLEERAIIDGDALTVYATGPTGPTLALYYTTQLITPPGAGPNTDEGCEMDPWGRVINYWLMAGTSATPIAADRAILYQHHPDPVRPRGIPELATAIPVGQDLKELIEWSKCSAKLTSSFAAYVTTQAGSQAEAQAGFIAASIAARKQAIQSSDPTQPSIADSLSSFAVDGVKLITLQPGQDLKTVQDHRPTNEQREFYRDLVRELAYAMGIDPEAIYYVADMSSASTRYSLQKLQRWLGERRAPLEHWCQRTYEHIIAPALATGALPPCADPDWTRCLWIPQSDLTIDRSRDGALQINLVREGLADPNEWTLKTSGQTVNQILLARAEQLSTARALEHQYDLPPGTLLPGALGATTAYGQLEQTEAATADPDPDPDPDQPTAHDGDTASPTPSS